MTPVEIALAKQRLQLDASAQRMAIAQDLDGLQPVFQTADQIHAGWRWLRRHPEAVAGAVALLAASRADARRFLWRWGRRTFVAWKLWRNSERWLHQHTTPR